MNNWMIACLAVGGVAGCSGDGNINLGDNDPVALGSKLEDYSGRWQGYAEAHEFTLGSDRMLLTIDDAGEGYAVFGEGAAPPPATNPDAGYPEDMDPLQLVTQMSEFEGGVRYPLHDVIVQDRRIRSSMSMNDLWQDWCRLQQPVRVLETDSTSDDYALMPYNYSAKHGDVCILLDSAGTPRGQVDCEKLLLHESRVCICAATTCEPNLSANRVDLDAALQSNGEQLIGTLTVSGRVTVRLTRQ